MRRREIIKFYVLSFTWGILHTLVGLFTLLFISIFMKKQVQLFTVAGRICIYFPNKHFGSVSLGIVYIASTKNRGIHAHELGHTIQNIRFGPLFLPLIGIPSIIRAAFWRRYSIRVFNKTSKYPEYDGIWFEGQATRLGRKYFVAEVNTALDREGI